MHNNRLIGLFIVLLLQNAAVSFHAAALPKDIPGGSDCAGGLSSSGLKNLPGTWAPVRLLRQLPSPGDRWLGWHQTATNRVFLAAVDQNESMPVYEPLKDEFPVFVGKVTPGATFTRAAWFANGEAKLVAGDSNGYLIRYDVNENKSEAPEYQGAQVAVLPEVSAGDQLLLGLGDLARVRIMPVGSVGPRDLTTEGRVNNVSLHRTSDGRTLAAVATAGAVEVFDVNSTSETPLVKYSLREGSEPQWLVDEKGESYLIFLNAAGQLAAANINTGGMIVRPAPKDARITTLRTSRGQALIFAASQSDRSELIDLKHFFSPEGYYSGVSPAHSLIETADGTVYLAYSVSENGARNLRVLNLSDRTAPVFSQALENDETVKSFAEVKLATGRSLLAAGTSHALYVFDLPPRQSAGQ
jgi:hypothetical protein